MGARPSRRRSAIEFSTASRRRSLSETAIVRGAAAVDMLQVYHGDQAASTSHLCYLTEVNGVLSIVYLDDNNRVAHPKPAIDLFKSVLRYRAFDNTKTL